MAGRRGRRRRKLLDDLEERRGYSHLKEEALDRTMWRTGFGRGFGPAVRQTPKLMNKFGLFPSRRISRRALGPTQPPIQCLPAFFLGGAAAGQGS